MSVARGVAGRSASPVGLRRAGWIVFLLSAMFGALPLAFGVRRLATAERRLWTARPTPAVVVQSMIRDSVMSRSGLRIRQARVVVRHRYRVDGRRYESALAYPLDDRIPGHRAREVAALFPPGRRVTTWVPAREPGAAFVMRARERHYIKSTLPAILAGLGFFAFGACFFWLTRRVARQAEEPAPAVRAAA